MTNILTTNILEEGEHRIKTSPAGAGDGDFVSFYKTGTLSGCLIIDGFDGTTTLSKENARELAAVLLAWAGTG